METNNKKKPFARPIPLLEVCISFFSIYAALLLFLQPDIFSNSGPGIYENMNKIMPQSAWGVIFLIAALIKVFGLVLNKGYLRMAGLALSSVIYTAFTVSYALDFPNFGTGLFAIMTAMSFISIFYVKVTEL